jgi:hypothetical protein
MFVFTVSNYLPYKYKYILNSSKVKIKLFSVFTYILTFPKKIKNVLQQSSPHDAE